MILLQNYSMRRRLLSILILIFICCPSFAKTDKLDVKSQSFMDLGKYIETLEINDETPVQEQKTVDEKSFEEDAIIEISKRYEEQAVELKLDDINDGALEDINSDRIFKLRVNENQYRIEQTIKADNMIWDNSKLFTQAFSYNAKKRSPIPGMSSNLSAQVSPDVEATIGQTYLYDSLGPSVLFVRSNESKYNTGSVVSYKGDGLNLAVGSFSASYNHSHSGGAILSTDDIYLPKNAGSLIFGGAYFANEELVNNKTTSGAFAEYTYKRLKLNAQVGQSKYSNTLDYDTSLYFMPELQVTDSLSIKTRIIRNVTRDIMQDELALSFKPKNNDRNFEFSVTATNKYNQMNTINQSIRLSTSFRI